MTWKPHVTVAALCERQGRLLLVQEQVDGHRCINQPAGHLEDHETLLQAVVRETREETGWAFEPEALVGIYRWRAPDGKTFVRFSFAGQAGHQFPDAPLDDGIEDTLWLTPDEIRARADELRSPLVIRCMEDYLAGIRYPLELLKDIADAAGP